MTFTVSAPTAICDDKPIISIFRIFLRKVIESSFWCKFISFACCARAYESWKQCQWIMRTLTCKHKIWEENWLYLRPYWKAFPVFNVLETCREVIKSNWMQVNKILLTRDRTEQFLSFFVCSFQWNQTTMRWSRVTKASHFLKILANCVASMLFHCFYDS